MVANLLRVITAAEAKLAKVKAALIETLNNGTTAEILSKLERRYDEQRSGSDGLNHTQFREFTYDLGIVLTNEE